MTEVAAVPEFDWQAAVDDAADDFLAEVIADELPSACMLENGACESCQ